MRRILTALLLLTLAAPAWAQDLGSDAYRRGDYATALEKWRPLAERGYPDFQSALGDMYALGQGVAQDFAEAEKWWRLAAAQGHAAPQNKLGVMYSEGQGLLR
jgi:TPR repeat protein